MGRFWGLWVLCPACKAVLPMGEEGLCGKCLGTEQEKQAAAELAAAGKFTAKGWKSYAKEEE